MGTEDFTFPRINDTFPYIIDSPPLWNSSSTSSSSKKGDLYEENSDSKNQRKSFSSSIQNGKKSRELEDEEVVPMDLLWEVFNEEVVEYRSLKNGRTTKNGLVHIKNKPSMLEMLKVLKRLFSINNSHGKSTRRIL